MSLGPSAPGPAGAFPPEILAERRERLLARIDEGVAVVGANPELTRSRDTEVPYRPGTDLYYLTGFEEPDAVAVLSTRDPERRFTLFARPRDPEKEAWSGPRAGLELARSQTGADAVHSIEDLDEQLPELLRAADRIHYVVGVDERLDRHVREAIVRARRSSPRTGVGPRGVEDLEYALGEMRCVKDAEEQRRMRTAASIAVAGHRALVEAAEPGVGEWELEAVLEGTFRRLGATGPAFPSIVGSGPNATYLHYTENRRRTAPGDLVLVDAGAEWGMYASDLTRTFPVSGRFSRPQRAVYEVVLEAEAAGIAAARPGAAVSAVHDAAVRVLTQGLLDLGLLEAASVEEAVGSGAYRRFYMHQTSHWLGLDVHDVGAYRQEDAPVILRPGMVLTVEPGLYFAPQAAEIPEEYRGTGVRIEDTVLITAAGAEVLTGDMPVAPDAVERLVGSGAGRRLAQRR